MSRAYSRRRIQELADWYADEGHRRHNAGTLDTAALDAELRAILREEIAPLSRSSWRSNASCGSCSRYRAERAEVILFPFSGKKLKGASARIYKFIPRLPGSSTCKIRQLRQWLEK